MQVCVSVAVLASVYERLLVSVYVGMHAVRVSETLRP